MSARERLAAIGDEFRELHQRGDLLCAVAKFSAKATKDDFSKFARELNHLPNGVQSGCGSSASLSDSRERRHPSFMHLAKSATEMELAFFDDPLYSSLSFDPTAGRAWLALPAGDRVARPPVPISGAKFEPYVRQNSGLWLQWVFATLAEVPGCVHSDLDATPPRVWLQNGLLLSSADAIEVYLKRLNGDGNDETTSDNAMLPASDIAKLLGIPVERMRKRLDRYRLKNAANAGTDFIENQDAGSREPRFLYRFGAVRHDV